MIRAARALLLWALVVGCSGHHGLPPAMEGQRAILDAALTRKVPPRLHGRLGVSVRSEPLGLAGSTGGALFLDRPGRGHLAVFWPWGGPLATAQTDGTGLAVAVIKDRRHYVAADAGEVLYAVSGGKVTLDLLLGLLVGELPFSEDDVTDAALSPDGDLTLTLRVSRSSRLAVVLDDVGGVPKRVELVTGDDTSVFTIGYAGFAVVGDGPALLPGEVVIDVPSLQLRLEWKVRSWEIPAEVPEVFGMEPPEGYVSSPLTSLLSAPQ